MAGTINHNFEKALVMASIEEFRVPPFRDSTAEGFSAAYLHFHLWFVDGNFFGELGRGEGGVERSYGRAREIYLLKPVIIVCKCFLQTN